jgi:kynurenine formamidase
MAPIDLSQPLEADMPVYPGSDPVRFDPEDTRTAAEAGGSRVTNLHLDSHMGTHVDAPAHTIADGRTLDDFAVGDFRFEARVVDCTPCEPRARLTTDRLPPALANDPAPEDGPAPAVDCLLFRTDWSDHWGTDRYRDSPYLGADLAAWCAERDLHVGVDTFSPDPVPSADPAREGEGEPEDLPAHAALCGAGRFILENLRGLDRLPERVSLEAYPLAIVDADGSPIRAVAHV